MTNEAPTCDCQSKDGHYEPVDMWDVGEVGEEEIHITIEEGREIQRPVRHHLYQCPECKDVKIV